MHLLRMKHFKNAVSVLRAFQKGDREHIQGVKSWSQELHTAWGEEWESCKCGYHWARPKDKLQECNSHQHQPQYVPLSSILYHRWVCKHLQLPSASCGGPLSPTFWRLASHCTHMEKLGDNCKFYLCASLQVLSPPPSVDGSCRILKHKRNELQAVTKDGQHIWDRVVIPEDP